ncbi:hypothetical protein MMC12_008608 [Toensbergia leucococca]|nr:hypothetical protein [Toensbergia leucococca]
MAEIGIIASVIGVAGAGFRLSLILNAVSLEVANADLEIQTIAKGISLFSLMLKQLGMMLEEADSIATPSAIDTAKELSNQSQTVFSEVKRMVDAVQKKDTNGNRRAITVIQRIKWCFKKQRVNYLLGQLESLKLSLSVMMQILQFGKVIASKRGDSMNPAAKEKMMLQERAEIQNMVVNRHWSLVELRRLHQLAEREVAEEEDNPPPSYENIGDAGGGKRLAIESSNGEVEQSQALVKYDKASLDQLETSMNKAMAGPNRLLRGSGNVIDHLLSEWTKVRGFESPQKSQKYEPHYETDDDESSEASSKEGERSKDIRGLFIEGASSGPRLPKPSESRVKSVRFSTQVESDSEESDWANSRRRSSGRHLIHSDDSDSSELSPPSRRRNSDGKSTKRRSSLQGPPQNTRRPPAVGDPHASPNPYFPTGQYPPVSRDRGMDNQYPRQGPHSPQSPVQARPMPIPHTSWPGQPQQQSLRPPSYNQATGPFGPSPPGYGRGGPPPRQNYGHSPSSPGVPYPISRSPQSNTQSNSTPRREHRSRSENKNQSREKNDQIHINKKNAKKGAAAGLLGAGALAGLLDMIEGLGSM